MLDLSPQQDELRELQGHLTILKVGLLLVVALLAIRLWHLQVREGQYYRDLSENNRTRSVILEPARGLIYDRNGVLLANNVPSFNLYVTLEDVTDREALIKRLVGLIGLDEASLRKRLSERGAKLLARKLKGGLTLREAALIESHRLDLPGVMVQAESQRNYPARLTASHLLGYVGEVSADQLEKPEFGGLHQGSVVGQYGVEHTFKDEGHPLTNGATQGQYPPGSTLKIVMGAAALKTNTIDPATTIRCFGSYQFGRRLYKDWKAGGHGTMDVSQAIVDSCDVFFYTIGQRMGIEAIASYATQFGLGRETGIELPSERVGIVPSPAWKEKARSEPWLPGETISASIGQGYVTVTPLQMTSLIATVGNNGVSFRPRLIRAVMERTTGRLQELPAVARGQLAIRPETLALIQHALAGVVTEGTARRAKSSLVTIAGKTGTAQAVAARPGPEEDLPKKLRDHAWFISYAPTVTPRIAVGVLVEHMGHGGSAAAPLAKQLIETFIKLAPHEPLIADSPSPARSPMTVMARQEPRD